MVTSLSHLDDDMFLERLERKSHKTDFELEAEERIFSLLEYVLELENKVRDLEDERDYYKESMEEKESV